MRVAFDLKSVQEDNVYGVGLNIRYLLEFLEKESKKLKNFSIDSFSFSDNEEKLKKSSIDIFHYPYFHPFFLTLPRKKLGKTVVTIYDLIPLVYPKQYPPGLKGSIKFILQKKRLKNVDAVITISETSKKDIVRFLDYPAEKVFAIHIAPFPVFKKEKDRKILNRVVAKYKLPNKFVLYLGDVYYSKNIPTLVMACSKLKIPLVIVGKQAVDIENKLNTDLSTIKGPKDWLRYLINKPHPEISHYQLLKDMFENEGNVIKLGFVPDEDLIPIMNLATVYCQPSYYEGFGFGVVHAFACGVPVVISKTQALVEVAGDAALIADPFNPEDMAKKISMLLQDPSLRAHFIRRGNERLSKFSWQKTAEKTIKVYEQLLER